MNKRTITIIAVLIGLLLIGVFLVVPWVFMNRWGDSGGWMRPGMMGRDFAYHMPFGGIGMFIGWLIPLLIIGLLVAGAVASLINLSRPRNQSLPTLPATPVVKETTSSQSCPNCSRTVEPDWVACPYCGTRL